MPLVLRVCSTQTTGIPAESGTARSLGAISAPCSLSSEDAVRDRLPHSLDPALRHPPAHLGVRWEATLTPLPTGLLDTMSP